MHRLELGLRHACVPESRFFDLLAVSSLIALKGSASTATAERLVPILTPKTQATPVSVPPATPSPAGSGEDASSLTTPTGAPA